MWSWPPGGREPEKTFQSPRYGSDFRHATGRHATGRYGGDFRHATVRSIVWRYSFIFYRSESSDVTATSE